MRLFPGLKTCALTLLLAAPAVAQEALGARLSLELNQMSPGAEGACKLSFLVQNGYESDVEKAVFEAVLFDAQGQVNRLTLFDFGALPAGRPRVRQFVVPGMECEAIGRILINGASTCEAGELGMGACMEGLDLGSRTKTEVIG